MKMKNCLSASLVWLFPTLAIAQQGQWEPSFPFGDLTQIPQLDYIAPVHLIHVFDGSTPKAVAIPETTYQPCGGFIYSSDLARLWSFPLNGALGPGDFEDAHLCRTYRT